MFLTQKLTYGFMLLLFAAGLPAVPLTAAVLPYTVISGSYPEPSSVSATIDAGLLFGRDTDTSSLSGGGAIDLAIPSAPFQTARITEISVVLDDGVDFSIAFGALQAEARPGETRVTLIEPGPAGSVVNGKFDQLENLFAFEGQVWLSTQPNDPLDLSTIDPVFADLSGIELTDTGSQIQSRLSFDLAYETTVSAGNLQIPVTIQIRGGIHAIANKLVVGDFNQNSTLDAEDIDLLSEAVRLGSSEPMFDLNGDSMVDDLDRNHWVKTLAWTYFGDANLDGEFNSADFVDVFTAGEYEDLTPGNSGWATGDWDGDADFGTSDFVAAFTDGGYELGPIPRPLAVPEPSSSVLLLIGFASMMRRRKSV